MGGVSFLRGSPEIDARLEYLSHSTLEWNTCQILGSAPITVLILSAIISRLATSSKPSRLLVISPSASDHTFCLQLCATINSLLTYLLTVWIARPASRRRAVGAEWSRHQSVGHGLRWGLVRRAGRHQSHGQILSHCWPVLSTNVHSTVRRRRRHSVISTHVDTTFW